MALPFYVFLLPLIPIVIRLIQARTYRRYMTTILSEERMDADAHRSIALGMAQFSFAGTLALTVVNGTIEMNLSLTVYYLFLSFLLFFFVINIQTYKYWEWVDLIGDAAYESGTLCLILALIFILPESKMSTIYVYAITLLTLTMWGTDLFMRYGIRSSFLSTKFQVEQERK